MRYLAIIFLLVLGDQSLACSMDMDWVRENDINLAGLQADCSTYETRNYRFIEGFLRASPVVFACSFLGLVSFRLAFGLIRKKREQRSIRALIRISPMQLFDLIWLSSFVTVWFFAIGAGYLTNGPALTYSALFTVLGFPVVRVTLAFTGRLFELEVSRIFLILLAQYFPCYGVRSLDKDDLISGNLLVMRMFCLFVFEQGTGERFLRRRWIDKTMDPKEWLDNFLKVRGLSEPSGDPLWSYRVSDAEFEDLESNVMPDVLTGSESDSATVNRLFLLYAAEAWKRRYEGGTGLGISFFKF